MWTNESPAQCSQALLESGEGWEDSKPQGQQALIILHSPGRPVYLSVSVFTARSQRLPLPTSPMRLSVTSSPILMSPHTRVPLRPLKLPRGCPLRLCPEREGITP